MKIVHNNSAGENPIKNMSSNTNFIIIESKAETKVKAKTPIDDEIYVK
jgi:hypothetical protein